jgi:hypothetical protein
MRALDAVRDGKMSLDIPAGTEAATEGARLLVTAPARLFTADKLASY